MDDYQIRPLKQHFKSVSVLQRLRKMMDEVTRDKSAVVAYGCLMNMGSVVGVAFPHVAVRRTRVSLEFSRKHRSIFSTILGLILANEIAVSRISNSWRCLW